MTRDSLRKEKRSQNTHRGADTYACTQKSHIYKHPLALGMSYSTSFGEFMRKNAISKCRYLDIQDGELNKALFSMKHHLVTGI